MYINFILPNNTNSSFFFYLFRRFFLLIIICFFNYNHTYSQEDYYQAEKDSLVELIPTLKGEDKLMAMHRLSRMPYAGEYLETLLKYNKEYIEEARKQKNIRHEVAGMSDELTVYYNYNLYEKFIEKAPGYLEYFDKTGYYINYYENYRSLVEVYIYEGENQKALAETNKMYEKAKTDSIPFGIDASTYLLGYIYYLEHDYNNAKIFLMECVEQQKAKEPKEWNIVFDAYADLASLYPRLMDDNEILGILKDYRSSIIIFEDEVYETKMISEWKSYYGICTRVYIGKGDVKNAELYCDSLENIIYDHDGLLSDLYNYKGEIAELKGNYEEAYNYYKESHILDSINYGTLGRFSTLFAQIRVLYKLNRGEEAYLLTEALLIRRDSMYNLSVRSQLDELRTVYEVDKLTAESDLHRAEKEILRQRWFIGIISSGLLLIALFIYAIYSRRLKKKNLSLYNQAKELNRKEKAVESCFLSKPVEELSKEMQLYRRVNESIKAKKLFIDPNINRKKLADYLGTNETYLADAIKHGTGETFSNYISNLRLQYALELLNDYPELTFDAIAIDSGHGSYSQFFRSFIKKYGMSPSEYRKLLNKKKISDY